MPRRNKKKKPPVLSASTQGLKLTIRKSRIEQVQATEEVEDNEVDRTLVEPNEEDDETEPEYMEQEEEGDEPEDISLEEDPAENDEIERDAVEEDPAEEDLADEDPAEEDPADEDTLEEDPADEDNQFDDDLNLDDEEETDEIPLEELDKDEEEELFVSNRTGILSRLANDADDEDDDTEDGFTIDSRNVTTEISRIKNVSEVDDTMPKYIDDDGDDDLDDILGVENDDDDNSEDSDFEVYSKSRLRGKGRGKRRTNVPLNSTKADPITTTKRGKKRAKKDDKKEEGNLFEIVKSGKTALTIVVDEWIEAYKADRDSALLDLIQFFIHCSGCRGTITPLMYASMEHAEIIRKMTEEFDEDSGDYPLITPGQVWKRFKANLCEFISVLVRQCKYSIIYDQYMMDNIISLLTGLTDSQVRAFRHTSTLCSMKLMTALVDVALNLSINLDHTQRQYEAERSKQRAKQASSERLEMLMSKRQEIEENQEEIRNMLTYIFKGVFVHRYRDTIADIRAICMVEIGIWMKRYPGMFLDDSYLKYVGWTLYDRYGEVRLNCLKSLIVLYETEELAPKLELFTNRFKDRIVEMTLDKEYDVAVSAVRLTIAILKINSRFSESVLTDKDCENVYELVYSSHRAVSQAAGEFLNQKLFIREPEEIVPVKSRKGKKLSNNTPLIRDLVQFFIESELHEHGAYLVDSLWEINEMLKDWECMTDLLIEELPDDEEPMDDRQETSLVEIMVCCVKQAATGDYPVGRGPSRKLTTKESKQVQDDKIHLTEHFIVALPLLLGKYQVDAEKITNLLLIPQYLDLDIYTTSRQEKNLDALLKLISEVTQKHTDSEVLENCAKVLETFTDESYTIAGKCSIVKATLVDNLVEKLKESFQDFFQEGEEPDEDEAYALMAALKRIYAFYGCHDLNAWGVWEYLHSIVKGGLEGHGIPEEIVCKALATCHLSIMWSLETLNLDNPDKSKVKELKRNLMHLMQCCHELLYMQRCRLQEEAYISLSDLLIVFNKTVGNSKLLQGLIYQPDKNMQMQLGAFLNDNVFIDDEDDEMDENQKIEDLHKRRNFLACFCKLIVYNVIDIKNAADMFKHYMRFYNDYGDIIKATLGKAREINKVITAKTLALSLTQLFQELFEETNHIVERQSEAFQSMKELARRFSLSFGLDLVKNREAVAAMHKEGIVFSLTPLENPYNPDGAPPHLAFLEVLSEFSCKLTKQDKRTVLSYLDKHLEGSTPCDKSEDWAPLHAYRGSLIGEGDMSLPPPFKSTKAKQKSSVKRKLVDINGDFPTTFSKEGVTPHRSVPQPLTSTAIKRSRRGVPDVNYAVDQDFSDDDNAENDLPRKRR